MTPTLAVVSGSEIVRALGKIRFFEVGERRRHLKLRHADGKIVIVPLHTELAPGTLRSVLRQAGLSVEEPSLPIAIRRSPTASGFGARERGVNNPFERAEARRWSTREAGRTNRRFTGQARAVMSVLRDRAVQGHAGTSTEQTP